MPPFPPKKTIKRKLKVKINATQNNSVPLGPWDPNNANAVLEHKRKIP